MDEFRTDLPLLAVEALRDEAFVVESMDGFIDAPAAAGASEYYEVDSPHSFAFEPDLTEVSNPMVGRAMTFAREA